LKRVKDDKRGRGYGDGGAIGGATEYAGRTAQNAERFITRMELYLREIGAIK
jgi:hypothetical protein